MNGFAPLTYTTIYHYSQLTGTMLDSEDIGALIVLDSVMLSPGDSK